MEFNFQWHKSRERKLGYVRRNPSETLLYRLVFNLHEDLETCWEEKYQTRYGAFRTVVREAFWKYLDCGILVHGCARAWCKNCKHSEIIPLSCKCRGLCPSCDTKRMLLFAEHLHENVLEPVPQRHMVLSLPKRIRAYIRYDRERTSLLFTAAWQSIKELCAAVCPEGIPGAVLALHSTNDMLEFNPHLHGLISDGVFLPDGSFQQLSLDPEALRKVFEHKLLSLLRDEDIITQSVIDQLTSWQHSGFSAWLGPAINPEEQDARLFISEYVGKAQIKLANLELLEVEKKAIIRCRKDETTSKDYDPMDLLAAITPAVPNKWEQTVRYVGYYSARTRGKRRKLTLEQTGSTAEGKPEILPPPAKKKASKSWARLIRKIYEADPLVCPRCGEPLKVIAVIIDPGEARSITSHLGIPDYRAPPPFGQAGSSTSRHKLRNAA